MNEAEHNSVDERFMTAALKLAQSGKGSVEPNPMVGALIVRDGQELSRGFHRIYGGRHGEIEALRAAERAGLDVRGATVYVTLEPCCHYGKTPPCTDAIIAAGISRVVVAMADPDDHVSGKGIRQLVEAGIKVNLGICRRQAEKILAPYRKLRKTLRPWVICKWAQTSDGFLALPPSAGRWISCPQSRRRVHEIRAQVDGILVGIGTVLADDPLLTNRSGGGAQPVRIVLDSDLRIPVQCQLTNTPAVSQVIVATTVGTPARKAHKANRLHQKGVDLVEILSGDNGLVSLPDLLDQMGKRGWMNLLVEGGPKVLASFVEGSFADELIAFVSPDPAPVGAEGMPKFDIADVGERVRAVDRSESQCGSDKILRLVLRD